MTKQTPSRARSAPSKGKAPIMVFLLAAVAGVPLVMFALPVLAILSIGLLPAAVAFTVDSDPGKNRAIAIAAMNLAGIAPFVMDMFQGAMTMQNGMVIIMDIYTWLVVYGAAAMGGALTVVAPPVTAVYIKIVTEARARDLKREQERLIKEWGDGVVSTRSTDTAKGAPRKPGRKAQPRRKVRTA